MAMAKSDEALAQDPTASTDHHCPDDRFIPVRAPDIVAALVGDADCFGPDAALLGEVAGAIDQVINQESCAFERDLADRYAAVNPDRDTVAADELAAARTPERYADLERRLGYVLEKANFAQLSDVQIDAAVHAANTQGLRVRLDPSRVVQLAIWVRGHARIERRRRTLRQPVHGVPREVSVYRRVAVVARLKDDPHVLLKMFKEIPVEDLEALLPHAEVRMNWFDRIKLMGGGAGMVGTTAGKVFKLVTTALVVSRLAWILLLGCGLLVFRTFMGYRNVRTQRDLQRTTNLYYQNLGNNAGVIHALVWMIAQEEAKEAFLAYAFCHAAARPINSADELRERIEAHLTRRFKVSFTFDIEDALESLSRLELWTDRAHFQVLPPKDALDRLRRHWLERRSQGYHESMACGCAATGDPDAAEPLS